MSGSGKACCGGCVMPPSRAACAHCGSRLVSSREPRPADDLQFCCGGCRAAYVVLHGDATAASATCRPPQPAPPAAARAFAEFDDPAFTARHVRTRANPSGDLHDVHLVVENVTCASCVGAIERLPARVPGLIEARVDLRGSTAQIVWDPGVVPLSAIASALHTLGHTPHPAKDVRTRELLRTQDRSFLVRIAVAGAIAINLMLLALALYAAGRDGMQLQHEQLFRVLSGILGVICLAWPGAVFFASAWRSLRTRAPNLDVPIALALAAGGITGLVNTFRGTGELYFDSLSALVFLLLVGRWIQRRQQRWAANSVEMLYSLTPHTARRVEGETVREVPTESLVIGDVVEVRAGDTVPADGQIIRGESHLNTSILTGESKPMPARPGAKAAAGEINLDSAILIRVEAGGREARIGKLLDLVADAAQRRAPIIRWADRLSGHFVVAMLFLAGVTLITWLFIDPNRAVENAATLLIVTCPCALGLALPLIMTLAIGRGAQRRILIKGGDALEALTLAPGCPGTFLLDKTGTITEGRTALVRWHGDESAKPLVAAIEASSNHPIAQATLAALGPPSLATSGVVQFHGAGIEGFVGERRVRVGSPRFVEHCTPRSDVAAALDLFAAQGLTPVAISVDGLLVAAAGFGDAIRADAAESLCSLRAEGWRIGILSGDDPRVVECVARAIELPLEECHGARSPEAKLAAVRDALRLGPVVMVGDGVNDSAALAAATVGIAVHGGAEASLNAADIYLDRPGLEPLLELTAAARGVRRAVKRCLAASVTYNLVAAVLAITGTINPLIAAIMMPLSSLTMLAIAYASRTFAVGPEQRQELQPRVSRWTAATPSEFTRGVVSAPSPAV